MSARRDFLAFTAGAIVAKTVLPIAARAEPDWTARTDLERRVVLLFRQLGEPEQDALLRGLQRQQAGMPMLEAMRGVYVELGRPVPANLLA